MVISSSGGLSVMTDPFAQLSPVQEMFRALEQSGVTVYGFDPAGLNAPRSIGGRDLFASPSILKAPNAVTEEDRVRQARDDLMAITDATGGRTIAFTNTPEVAVPGVFEENSLYYMVGFRSADRATDGRLHRVQVKVNRPDAIVHTRIGYFPTREASKAHTESRAHAAGLRSFDGPAGARDPAPPERCRVCRPWTSGGSGRYRLSGSFAKWRASPVD